MGSNQQFSNTYQHLFSSSRLFYSTLRLKFNNKFAEFLICCKLNGTMGNLLKA